MLKEVEKMHGWTIHAIDGEIGKVDELLFDDEHWTVRYLIVETGNWLASRKVLVSPLSFGFLDWDARALHVNLTREKIRHSPGVETDQPVSRQWETDYLDYYGWPYYWGDIGGGEAYGYPGAMLASPQHALDPARSHGDDREIDHAAAHLRSTKEVTGYGISASDGHLGHIEDFLVDDRSWRIVYLAVDTKDWWPGKKVLIPPAWIEQVNWSDSSVTVDVTREQVKNAPEWDRSQPIDAALEDSLYAYFARRYPEEKVSPMNAAKQSDREAFVAIYDTHGEAEAAVRGLQKRGFDMTKLSIVGKDYHTEEEVVGYYTAGDRMRAWGANGAFWGGVWSLMFGSAFFLIPGFGPILAAGPIVAWIVGALESAVVVGGLSVLGGALFSIGIPNDRILLYENHLKAGKFLVLSHDVTSAKDQDMIALEATRFAGIK